MPYVKNCEIRVRQEAAPGHFRIAFRAPEIAAAARPGQFCMVQVSEGYHPFLRRPMSFERIFADGISILFKVEGEGTRILANTAPEQELSIQGPLGNGFTIDAREERHIIVAGGIGVAPFPALAEAITATCGRPPEVIVAARTEDLLLCIEDFRLMGCTVYVATDDGSAGEQATSVAVLERLAPPPGSRVYACGPMPMLKAAAQAAKTLGLDCQVSLEAQMACGDGACLGCVVESTRENEGERMVRVCADGPVFDAGLIDWDAHKLKDDR
ncbi:MAG: Dihydroorotate dehydrogenase electron transfer subunit [Candidatus Hydrogenedentes bacterium]|nr:Dihydroorotate dehydrogenase electron transfer subunit [Candidatus Hydrogenedentota bacterium]